MVEEDVFRLHCELKAYRHLDLVAQVEFNRANKVKNFVNVMCASMSSRAKR
jgi:hypothetical protein